MTAGGAALTPNPSPVHLPYGRGGFHHSIVHDRFTASWSTGAGATAFWTSFDEAAQAAPVGVDLLHEFVHLAQAAHQRLHEGDGAFGVVLERADELVVGHFEAFDVALGDDRGGARAGFDQAHLAEHLAGLERADPPAPAPDQNLDRARDDEEGRVALVAFAKDGVSGPESD